MPRLGDSVETKLSLIVHGSVYRLKKQFWRTLWELYVKTLNYFIINI